MTPRRSTSFPLALLILLAFSVSFVILAPSDASAKKKVKLQFEPNWCPKLYGGVTCNSSYIQSNIKEKFKDIHTFCSASLSIITDCSVTDYDKIIKFVSGTGRNDDVYGYEPPCQKTGKVYGGAFDGYFTNCIGLANAMGNIAAHEHGHHWRVPHAPSARSLRTNNVMNPKPVKRDLVKSYLTFDTFAVSKIATFMRTSNRTKADPQTPRFEPEKVVVAVYGYHELLEDEKFSDPCTEDITVTLSGNYLIYDFGWVNPAGEFVSQINAGQPTGRLTLYGAERVDFAVRNIETHEVFTVGSCAGTLTFLPPLLTGEMAEMPILPPSAVYYGAVEINFAGLGYSAALQADYAPDGFISWEDAMPQQPGLRLIGVIALLVTLTVVITWRLKVLLASRSLSD